MDTSDWSTETVAEYLETLGLGSYQSVFIENDINGEALPLLKESHLKEIGMKSVGHRITFLQWLDEIKQPQQSAVRSQPKAAKRSRPEFNSHVEEKVQEKVEDSSDQDDDADTGRGWQQRRRAAMMKRMQNNDERGHKKHIMQPEMDFGSNEGGDGLFGAPPSSKKYKQTNYGDDDEDEERPLKFDPNPFSREDDEPPKPIPRIKKTTTQKKPQRKTPTYQERDESDDFEDKSHPVSSYNVDFDQFGENDVPPMGGSKLGGGFPANRNRNMNNFDDEDEEPPKPVSRTKRAAPTMNRRQPAPVQQRQQRKPAYQESDDDDDDFEDRAPPPSSYNVDFDQFGEDDVPPMGGSKLGGGFPGNRGRNTGYDDRAYEDAGRDPFGGQVEADPNDRVECSICHRKFAADRIEKHEKACRAAASRKKKVFDSSKMRVAGTDAEKYQGMSREEPKKKKVDFRAQHDALVANMRAARQYQKYEEDKKKGKAVGPPPEMPAYEMPDDDRKECPYCGRKFGEEAYERHVKFCETKNAGRMRTTKPARKGRR